MVAQKAIIIGSRIVDAATITPSSESSTLPVRFLQNKKPFKVWRSNGIVGEYLILSLASAKALNAFAFVNPNFSTVTITAATTLGGLSAPAFTSGAVSLWPAGGKPVDEDHAIFTGLALFTNDTEYGFWKITFADYDAGATYTEFGRLCVDRKFQFSRGIDAGLGLQIDSKDDQFVTDFNSLFTAERGDNSRNYVFPVSAVSYNDVKDYLYGLFRYSGKSKDFVFCADPGADDDIHLKTVHAVFAEMPSMKLQTVWHGSKRTWNLSLPLREVT